MSTCPMKLTINRQADVILTNLVLTLQSNQPGTLAAAAVEIGATGRWMCRS